jgi:hypothetical protein
MPVERSRISTAAVLAAGVVVGWVLAGLARPAATIRAEGGDRWGDTIVATGPVMVRYDERLKTALKQDAVYYLDYRGGRLLGAIPTYQQRAGSARLLDVFAERDLVADFKLDAEAGPRPHFLMTTCELGAYSLGWAPLLVFETTSNQVATYRLQQQTVGTSTKPVFELVEVRSVAASQPGPTAGS